jgi:phosphotransferase system HPr (HPr) family protein
MTIDLPYRATATVRNPKGLHMRPLAMIVQKAQGHEGQVFVRRGTNRADAKSLLHLMTLGAEEGMELEVEATGNDGNAMTHLLVEVIESRFDW